MGLVSGIEATLLDSSTLFGSTRYLRLLQWTGAVNGWNGTVLNEDGSLPTNVSEVSTGGYSVASNAVTSTQWGAAVPGAPTLKQFPKSGGTGFTFTPTGGATWTVCGYAWTTTTASVSSANVISSGVFLDSTSTPALQTVDGTHPLVISDIYPIVERMGDPGPDASPF